MASPADWWLAVAHGRRTNASAKQGKKAGAGGKQVRAAKWDADSSQWPDERLTGRHRLGEHRTGGDHFCDLPGCNVNHASFTAVLKEKKAAEAVAGRGRGGRGRGRGQPEATTPTAARGKGTGRGLPPGIPPRRRQGWRGGGGDSRQLDSSRAQLSGVRQRRGRGRVRGRQRESFGDRPIRMGERPGGGTGAHEKDMYRVLGLAHPVLRIPPCIVWYRMT